ncbi:MAG: hypothetical protein FJX46_03055 [Alphaproteobacteria bacterium]|nr:hypothetical protein [Alphaproteobacteria bacterium]
MRSAVGRIALRDGRFKEALEAIEPAINAGARDRRLHDWYLECLFRLGRFAEMRQIASHRLEGAEADASFPHEMREVLRLWAGRTA